MRLCASIVMSLVLSLPISQVNAAELTPIELNTKLTAVSKREAYVFASTPDGLFRAPIATKRWEHLNTPPEMPLNGKFASQPVTSPLILYFARGKSDKNAPKPLNNGLYQSQNNGQTWERISGRGDLESVLHHPSGMLYATAGAFPNLQGNFILRSEDMGKSWRDITGNASGALSGVIPDPYHPGLVLVQGWSGRSYLWEAEDENFHWKAKPGWRTVRPKPQKHLFFERTSASSNRYHTYRATLKNYFDYDFGNFTEVHALEVVPLKNHYEFARGERIVVPVRVVFHFDGDILWRERRTAAEKGQPFPRLIAPEEKLVDQPGGIDFWGLRVERGDIQIEKRPAERRIVSASVEDTKNGKNATKLNLPDPATYKTFKLTPTSPYERNLELNRFADFSEPGDYRVQILYDSASYPDGLERVWDGRFTSPVFTIVIRP